ncbi:hypothetical protein KKF81_04825 [Candidatus Micrarchaeota archaeon]|nr:hypothetical protein [Candidatus Micrarchaeota archaeon]MBU1166251.1 hypothetical protein [Candidatus Micrarchaeota archaeon]MBU1887191.1 hypothetical protein [Candidatus Micrarchaeota archaeon]
MSDYKVKIINPSKKEKLMEVLYSPNLYEQKASIHGTCVKLFTDSRQFKDMWEENFEIMPDSIRPHARLFAINNGKKKLEVLYEPISKTVIIYNCNYYGWIKSIALALVADFFEDFTSEHRRYSVHGSFVDYGGKGVAIAGPSKSGKTTLTYGLLLDKRYNFLTDDWFFVRLNQNILVHSSEKNSYIRDDLAQSWPEFAAKLKDLKCDEQKRAIIDVKKFFGVDRIRKDSVLSIFVILTRNKSLPVLQKLDPAKAISFMLKNDFCNPHQLIRTEKKKAQRKKFFKQLFARVPVYLLNTIETPKESLERLKRLVES